MINKIYEKIKKFIKENYLWLLFYVIFIAVMTYPLPYYLYIGGGIIDTSNKIVVEDSDSSKGSFNMCYVEELYATIPTYLLSYVIPSWDLVEKEKVTLNDNETDKDLSIRNRLYLEEANQNAVLTAFKNTNYDLKIIDNHLKVIYIDEDSKTNLSIGDEILEIDNNSIKTLDDIANVLNKKNVNDKVSIKVINNQKEIMKEAIIKEENHKKIIGIAAINIYDYETTPKVEFSFSNSESGPSGGLILSLSLYDKLVSEDITKGLKIAGTGTIDKDGNVGSIGGVKFKLKGAVDSKADIFLVPNGNNYKEAIKLKNENNYNIKIIGVDTFIDAINKLN